jgi:hypothetical protein
MAQPIRGDVQRLADEIGDGRLDVTSAVEEALRRADADAACSLLLAAAVAGRPADYAQVAAVLPELSSIDLFPVLVGLCTGDRVTMLLDLVDADRMSDERDAVALFLAVELLAGAPPPPRLAALVRTRARRQLGIEASILVAMSAAELGDPDVLEVAKRWLPMAQVVEAKVLRERLRSQLSAPTLSLLPEKAPARVVSGFTVRRTVSRVGRNDPCHCGSGKKYKKCCAEKDAARASDPSPLPGMTRAEYLRSAGQHLTMEEVDDLRPRELAELDLSTLRTGPLIAALRRAQAFHRWDLAERAMSALAARTDVPGGDAEGHRVDLISAAVAAGNVDVAERQISLLPSRQVASTSDLLALDLARPTPETLGRIEQTALAGLREPRGNAPFDLSFALLKASPALGILVARASLNPHRWFDTVVMLDVIEEARDRLGLPPGDQARELCEFMLDRDVAGRVSDLRRGEAADRERLAAEADGLREKLHESRVRVAELEHGLRAQEASLSRLPAEQTAPRTSVPAAGATPSVTDEQERRRLRGKVDELKQLLTERNEERSTLRRQLAKLNDALLARPPDLEQIPDGEAEREDGDQVDPPRAVLRPSFAPSCGGELRALPAAVARRVLDTVASLAGGDLASWRQVKRMASAADPLMTGRIGIHHRVLFRVEDGELAVVSVIHRKDLDTAIKRHGRAVSR